MIPFNVTAQAKQLFMRLHTPMAKQNPKFLTRVLQRHRDIFGAALAIALLIHQPTSQAETKTQNPQQELAVRSGSVLSFTRPKQNQTVPRARFGIRDLALLDRGSYWQILCGVGLKTVSGRYLLMYYPDGTDESAEAIEFKVLNAATYETNNHLLDADAIPRFINEPITHAPNSFVNSSEPTLPLNYPAQLEWNTHFGAQTATDSSVKVQTSYFAIAKENTPLSAPSNALVAKIERQENDQIALLLDHGRGLYSKLHFKGTTTLTVNQGVIKGATVGIASSTRLRDSGQRVHWQTVLNHVPVAPNDLVELSFSATDQ